MDTTCAYTCAYCGEESYTPVDISAGLNQRYVEDCQVCCRPQIFHLRFDEDTHEATIDTEPMD